MSHANMVGVGKNLVSRAAKDRPVSHMCIEAVLKQRLWHSYLFFSMAAIWSSGLAQPKAGCPSLSFRQRPLRCSQRASVQCHVWSAVATAISLPEHSHSSSAEGS